MPNLWKMSFRLLVTENPMAVEDSFFKGDPLIVKLMPVVS